MRHCFGWKRSCAAVLILALQATWFPASAGTGSATLRGSVFSGSSRSPVVGARVHVGDPGTGEIYTSAPIAADGAFRVTGLPASAYQLAVQTPRGLYVVSNSVRLAAGEDRAVQLAVNAQAAPSPSDVKETRDRRRMSVWNNPLTATLIVLGAALVVGVVADQATNDDPASPFTVN